MKSIGEMETLLVEKGYKQHGETTWYVKIYDSGIRCEVNTKQHEPSMILRDRDHHLIDGQEYDLLIEADPELEEIHEAICGEVAPAEALVVVSGIKSDIVMPVVSVSEAKYAWDQYQELCGAILDISDFQEIAGERYKKKSAWRKLARFFNLDDKLIDLAIKKDTDGHIISCRAEVEIIAPNGRKVQGVGICSIHDKAHENAKYKEGRIACSGPCDGRKHFSNPEHDIPATAHTRAKNRGISDIIGAGEISAEELLS